MEILTYVTEKAIVLIPVLLILGQILKNLEFIPVEKLEQVFAVAIRSKGTENIAESSVKFAPHDIIIRERVEKDEVR